MIQTLCVVVPVYNDWPSALILLERLDDVARTSGLGIFVNLVDDGSVDTLSAEARAKIAGFHSLIGAEIVHLALNVGHQRAIAVGLCVAAEDHDLDAVLVMDGDGEDPPEAIPTLIAAAAGKQDFCIVAQRRRRIEKISFKVSYFFYKQLFRLVTGKFINFGNFSMTSRMYARRLVMISELWNNLAAAVLRSRLPVERVPIDRGRRYAGQSKMNFVSLIIHGFSGISVYAETILVRMLLLTLFLFVFTFLAIAVLFILRIAYPDHATPGWATTVSFGMIIILVQVSFTALSSLLMVLNSRVQRLIIPVQEFRSYIRERVLLTGRRPAGVQAHEVELSTTRS